MSDRAIETRRNVEADMRKVKPDWEGAEYRGLILSTTCGGNLLFHRMLRGGVWHEWPKPPKVKKPKADTQALAVAREASRDLNRILGKLLR